MAKTPLIDLSSNETRENPCMIIRIDLYVNFIGLNREGSSNRKFAMDCSLIGVKTLDLWQLKACVIGKFFDSNCVRLDESFESWSSQHPFSLVGMLTPDLFQDAWYISVNYIFLSTLSSNLIKNEWENSISVAENCLVKYKIFTWSARQIKTNQTWSTQVIIISLI